MRTDSASRCSGGCSRPSTPGISTGRFLLSSNRWVGRVVVVADRSPLLSWVGATCVGWLLGVPIIFVFALIGEAVGIGGTQVLVGAGMGAGIGLMQALALRRLL